MLAIANTSEGSEELNLSIFEAELLPDVVLAATDSEDKELQHNALRGLGNFLRCLTTSLSYPCAHCSACATDVEGTRLCLI